MANILDSIKGQITPEMIRRSAKVYGESEIGISKVIGSLAPTLLAGLLEKCHDPLEASSIFNTLKNFDPSTLHILDNDSKDFSNQLSHTIFGAKATAIVNAVASFSGGKPATVSSLTGFVELHIMGLLHKKISAEGLDAPGLARYLLGQKASFTSLLPASVVSVLGAAGITNEEGAQEKPSTGLAWFWPLLLLLGMGMALVVFLKNRV